MQIRIRNQNEHARFYYLLFSLFSLIFIRYTLQVEVTRLLSLAIIILIAVFGTKTEIITMMMCLIPLHETVDFYYSMTALLAIYIIKYRRNIKVNWTIILVMAMAFWELLHTLSSDFEYVSLLSVFIPMVLLAIMMSSDVTEIDYNFVVNTMAIATISTCITMLGQVLAWSNFDIAIAATNLRRLGMITEAASKSAITGGTIHPNSLGVICVLSITGLLQLRTVGFRNKWAIPMVAFMLLFGALTSSRTFLACLLLMVLLLFWGLRGGISKKIGFLTTVVLTTVVVLLLLSLLFPDLLEFYISRFFIDDITTGRDDLMTKYHKFIVENGHVMLFGVGVQDFGEKLITTYRAAVNIPHNSIQEVIVAWGIPGLIMFSALLISIIVRTKRYNKHLCILNYIPLIIIVFKSMAGQLLTSGYSMLALSYAYLSLNQNFSTRKKKNP